MKQAWLGLGGNVGDVRLAMAQALQSLDANDEISVELVSSIYKTPPWGLKDQPWFLNCCAQVSTTLSPEGLLEACQDVERSGKRERVERWGPRTIDVDILIFEGVEQIEQRLTIPHPRMAERAFVLIPLAEISPTVLVEQRPCRLRAEEIDKEGIEKTNTASNWWQRRAGWEENSIQ